MVLCSERSFKFKYRFLFVFVFVILNFRFKSERVVRRTCGCWPLRTVTSPPGTAPRSWSGRSRASWHIPSLLKFYFEYIQCVRYEFKGLMSSLFSLYHICFISPFGRHQTIPVSFLYFNMLWTQYFNMFIVFAEQHRVHELSIIFHCRLQDLTLTGPPPSSLNLFHSLWITKQQYNDHGPSLVHRRCAWCYRLFSLSKPWACIWCDSRLLSRASVLDAISDTLAWWLTVRGGCDAPK